MGGFRYSPLDESTRPLPSDEFYARRAAQEREKMKQRLQAQPLAAIPSLDEVFKANDEARAEQETARLAEIASSPYAWNGEGMKMTPQAHQEWKRQHFGLPPSESEA